MKNAAEILRNLLIVVLITVLALVAWYLLRPVHTATGTSSVSEIILTQKRNDSLQAVNLTLEKRIDTLNWQQDSLQNQLQQYTKLTQQIKQQRHETLHHLDTLDSDELQRFFAEFNAKIPEGW